MMNNRAQIFEQGLVLVVFVICTFALYSFLVYNNKITNTFDSIYPVISLYDQQKAISFYAKEAGKLSVQEAFPKTLIELGRECPKAPENRVYAIWKKDCVMKNAEIETVFLSNVYSAMQNYTNLNKNLPKLDSVRLEGQKIYFTFSPLILNGSLKSKIEINYNSDISYGFFLSEYNIDLNIENIYEKVFLRWDGCKNKDETAIKACMSELKLSSWDYYMLNPSFFSELKSKNNHYFDGKMQQITMKFKLEK